MLTLIENGEIYAPEPQGRSDLLLIGGRIARVGEIDRRAVEALGLEFAVIDATDCLVTPGLEAWTWGRMRMCSSFIKIRSNSGR